MSVRPSLYLSLFGAVLMAGLPSKALAQSPAKPVDEQALNWAYPATDPLGVLGSPAWLQLAWPVGSGLRMPQDCQQIAADWTAAANAHQATELTLQSALDIAICTSPELRQNHAMIQGVAAVLGQTKAAYWPSVSANLARARQSQYFSGSNRQDELSYATSKSLGLNWKLYDFGLRQHKVGAQNAQLDASKANLEVAARKLVLDLVQQYLAAQSAVSMRKAREQALGLVRQLLQSTLNRADKGLADQSEVLQARASLARAEYELSVSRGEAEKALANLGQLLGLQGPQRIQISSPNFEAALSQADAQWVNQAGHIDKAFEGWLMAFKTKHPAIAAAKAQLESAQHNLQVSKLEGMPSIDLAWNHYFNGRPDQGLSRMSGIERSATLTLRIPLFEGFVQSYKVRGAQAQLEQRKAERDGAEAQVLKEALFLHAEAQAALANLQSARQLARSAQEVSVSMQRKFERGAVDLMQLNQTLSALILAQADLIKSWTEWQSASLRLLLDTRFGATVEKTEAYSEN